MRKPYLVILLAGILFALWSAPMPETLPGLIVWCIAAIAFVIGLSAFLFNSGRCTRCGRWAFYRQDPSPSITGNGIFAPQSSAEPPRELWCRDHFRRPAEQGFADLPPHPHDPEKPTGKADPG